MGVPVRGSDARRNGLGAAGRVVWACASEPANLALWGVVLLAALTRLSCLDLIEFKGDEVGHLLRALRILEERRLPTVGSQASVGIAKPPMMSLLMAIPLLFGRDPRLASGFIALLNVGAVGGCFLLARRYYNLRVALIAAALFAVNPWAIVFSRKVFTADVLAPFLVLYLYALHAAIVDRAAWGWLVAVLSLGTMLLITFSPLPLALLLVVCVLGWRRQVRWRYLLTGAGLALLFFVPYLRAQLAHLRDVKALAQMVLRGGSAAAPGPGALQVATWLHSGRNLGALAGAAFTSFAPAHSPLRALDGVAALLFGLAILGVIAMAAEAWVRAGRRVHRARYTLLALWLVVSLAVVSSGIVRVETQYLIILYPAGFMAMALVVDRAWTALAACVGRHRSWARVVQSGLGAVLGAVVIWQVYCVFYLFGFVAAHDTSGGYGVPLRSWLAITAMVRREAAATGVDDVWAIVEGTDISCEQTPAILSYLLGPELEVTFLGQGGHEALLLPVGRPALYLLAREVSPPVEAMLGRLGAQERATLPASAGSAAARVLLVPGHTPSELLSLVPQPIDEQMLDLGLVLLGYEWPADARPGSRVRFATFWRFEEIPAAERGVVHSLLNHLLAADGQKVTQRDGFGLPERHWRPGLMLVQWFEMEIPPEVPAGDYTLLTGMYRLSDLSRNSVVDESNTPIGDSIRLGPVRVLGG